jgi:regulator of cell morphogenesis and NO signaling
VRTRSSFRSSFVCRREHAEFGQTLLALRRITGHYNLPTDACATVRGLYQGLEELDKLMQLHIHLENNVLFPRAAALLPGAGIERSQ